jgi:hypothetical protein
LHPRRTFCSGIPNSTSGRDCSTSPSGVVILKSAPRTAGPDGLSDSRYRARLPGRRQHRGDDGAPGRACSRRRKCTGTCSRRNASASRRRFSVSSESPAGASLGDRPEGVVDVLVELRDCVQKLGVVLPASREFDDRLAVLLPAYLVRFGSDVHDQRSDPEKRGRMGGEQGEFDAFALTSAAALRGHSSMSGSFASQAALSSSCASRCSWMTARTGSISVGLAFPIATALMAAPPAMASAVAAGTPVRTFLLRRAPLFGGFRC